MTNFYTNVEQEINDFIHRCYDLNNSVQTSDNQITRSCLTSISFDTFSDTLEHLDVFLDNLSSYTSDMSIEYDPVISIVSNCTDLVNFIHTHQYLFIEYAIDDYLFLDEHIDLIYGKVVQILDYLHHLPTTNSEIYKLEKQLLFHLPSSYSNQISSSLVNPITSTLIEQTSRLFSSTYNTLSNDTDDDDNDCIISSSSLFSSSPFSINSAKDKIHRYDTSDQSGSLLQLDKINLRTTILTHSKLTSSFQFDLTEFEQIENDLNKKTEWIEIERAFLSNIISIWSKKDWNIPTINPWPSEIFWALILNFKCSDMNLKYEFILIIQWSFCLLTIQALNRDWDLFFSKTLINTIIANRWRIVCFSPNIHLSIVGYNLNQMFLRLIRITSVLQYMKILSDQSSYLTSFFANIISSNLNNLTQRIEGTFRLLFVWIKQNADTFINANILERVLIICKSDQMQLSSSVTNLLDTLRQLKNCEQSIELTNKLQISSQLIADETMSKLYQRIHLNTANHFNDVFPPTAGEWRAINQQISYMTIACDKLLKTIFSQSECLNIDQKFDIYENILSSFVQAWTSILLERKYRFSDEMVHFLQKDYEYLQIFLSTNISDSTLVQSLIKSSALQQIAMIINLLRTGEKIAPNNSVSQLPNHEKWLRSRRSPSALMDFFQNACCCQRRNRVTTDPT